MKDIFATCMLWIIGAIPPVMSVFTLDNSNKILAALVSISTLILLWKQITSRKRLRAIALREQELIARSRPCGGDVLNCPYAKSTVSGD